MMKRFLVASILTLAGLHATSAQAQWGYYPSYGAYQSFGYNPYGYGQFNGWNGSSYYGNGGHDFQPHWHMTQTPFGPRAWYGNGPHDFVPHQHSRTPWSYQGYSNTGAGPTTSFYSQQPYYFAPW